MLTGYDAIVRNYCNVSEFDMRFGCSAWTNQNRELSPGFLWRMHFECPKRMHCSEIEAHAPFWAAY